MKAVIVGGGIAGPATAMALQHAGAESVVHEAWPRPDGQVGSYFTLTPNGLHALDAIGCLEVARSVGFPTRHNVMYSARGSRLGRTSLGAPLPDGTPALTMKRSELALALAEEACRRGIELRWGSRVTSVEPADHASAGPSVGLEDGSCMSGDLVVGADGVHSIVRGAIDPQAPRARYVRLTNFGGITRGAAADLEPEAWHFVFGKRAFFGAHATPEGDVVWFVNPPRPPITPMERAQTSVHDWQDWLAELVAGDRGPAAELIGGGELELVADNTHDLAHVPTWWSRRCVVVGDAAHAPSPSSGQGASMALEDAIVLAVSLRDAPSIEAGLHDFDDARRRRVERIVAVGARSSSAKVPGRVGRTVRDAFLRLVFRFVVTDRSTAWMTGHRVSWEAADDVSAGPRR